jgi:hypothetical protein
MLITTEQAKEHLKINATLNEATFAPFIPDAEKKFVKPFLGKELFELLETWTQTKDPQEAELKALYPFVVAVVSRGTMLIAAPHMDLNIGESGFSVTSTNILSPASRERVKDYMKSLEELTWSNVESMLKFLEENKDDYEDWVESDAFTMQIRNLINSAKEFDKYVDIDESRLTFQKLRKDMDNVEQMRVKNLISPQLFNMLLEKIRNNDDFEDKEAELLRFLQGFVANEVAAKSLGKDTAHVAIFNFNEARAIINRYPDDFPLYRDSDYYDKALPFFKDFENSSSSSIFVA